MTLPRRAPTTVPVFDFTTGKQIGVRRLGGLAGFDVIDHCTKCNGPIFRDSRNAHELSTRNVDNTFRHMHRRCPKATA